MSIDTMATLGVGLAVALGGSIVSVIIWATRVESKVSNLEREKENLKAKIEAIDSKVIEELRRLGESIAELRGFLQQKAKSLN